MPKEEVLQLDCPDCGRDHYLFFHPFENAVVCACGTIIYDIKADGTNVYFMTKKDQTKWTEKWLLDHHDMDERPWWYA